MNQTVNDFNNVFHGNLSISASTSLGDIVQSNMRDAYKSFGLVGRWCLQREYSVKEDESQADGYPWR
jgi:hypothetical protein